MQKNSEKCRKTDEKRKKLKKDKNTEQQKNANHREMQKNKERRIQNRAPDCDQNGCFKIAIWKAKVKWPHGHS